MRWWPPLRDYARWFVGDDIRSFREAWQDRSWAIVIPAVGANILATISLFVLWFALAAGTIHVLDWLGWMP